MTTLKDLIKEHRNIKESSAKIYNGNVERIRKHFKKEDNLNYQFLLDDYKEIIKYISNMNTLQTRKVYYVSIVVALQALKMFNTKAGTAYNDMMLNSHNEYNIKRKDQLKSEKQKSAWATYKDLKNVYKYYKNKIKIQRIRKKKELTNKEFNLLKKFIILSLYLSDPENNPPRRIRDYSTMLISKKLPEEDIDNNILYYKNSRKKVFFFNDYKTSSKYGEQILNVGRVLNNDLNLWLKYNKTNYLLPNKKKTLNMSPTNLTKFLQKIFFKRIGKNISVNLIRSIILSEYYKDVPKLSNMESLAAKMGHSVNEALSSYVKKD